MEDIERIIQDLDEDFFVDFLESVQESVYEIERQMVAFENNQSEPVYLYNTIKAVEHIKSSARTGFLDPIVSLGQTIEDFLLVIQDNIEYYHSSLGELILIATDELRVICEILANRRILNEFRIDEVKQIFHLLMEISREHWGPKGQELIRHFSHGDSNHTSENASARYTFTSNLNQTLKESSNRPIQTEKGVNLEDHIPTLEKLSCELDSRVPYWDNRTQHILNTALGINQNLKSPMHQSSLTAASHLHDIGMAFLPDAILTKTERFNEEDIARVQQHPQVGYQFASLVTNDQEVTLAVFQHHERYDGRGYPLGIGGENICTGAKILAIADTFFAMTHKRADRQFKKSFLRAVNEINNLSGVQFDPLTVHAFNRWIEKLMQRFNN